MAPLARSAYDSFLRVSVRSGPIGKGKKGSTPGGRQHAEDFTMVETGLILTPHGWEGLSTVELRIGNSAVE